MLGMADRWRVDQLAHELYASAPPDLRGVNVGYVWEKLNRWVFEGGCTDQGRRLARWFLEKRRYDRVAIGFAIMAVVRTLHRRSP